MTYTPGRRASGDSTPRGYARWERAAVNALRNPTSQGARLYQRRYALALQLADAALITGAKAQPYEFLTWKHEHKELRRDHATCSIFCTVLQITLDYGIDTMPGLLSVFDGTHLSVSTDRMRVRKLESFKRSIKCQVCASEIKPTP